MAIITVDSLWRIKNDTNKVVWVNGCIDGLHLGHTWLLREACRFGNVLVVGINSDSSVRRRKGPTRPIHSEQQRAQALNSLWYVDYVVIFEQDSAQYCLSLLWPDYHVKGEEYNVLQCPERQLVELQGGKTVYIPKILDISTTQILSKQ